MVGQFGIVQFGTGQFDTIIKIKIDSQISFLLESFEVKNDQDDFLGQKLSYKFDTTHFRAQQGLQT